MGGRPLRIGLTGGIASGKSTVADLFAGKGAPVIDTDRIARDVVEPGQPAMAEIEREFGPDIVDADRRLRRRRLRELVFEDENRRKALEATAASMTDRPSSFSRFASLPMVVVLPAPLTPTTRITNGLAVDTSSGCSTGARMPAIVLFKPSVSAATSLNSLRARRFRRSPRMRSVASTPTSATMSLDSRSSSTSSSMRPPGARFARS